MPPSIRRRTELTLALCGALGVALAIVWSPAGEATAPATTATPTAEAPSGFGPGEPIPALFLEAAAAARAGGQPAAARLLDKGLSASEPEASRARVVQGLFALESGRNDEARRLLASAPGPAALEDLRLDALSAAYAATGALRAARTALDELLLSTPQSPLRPSALLRLADLAFKDGAVADALSYVERARHETLSPAECETLETLAWTIGRSTGNESVLREAARRLLVQSPLAAARLDVSGVLVTRPNGDWRSFLSASDLLARAETLLEVEIPQGALVTLDAIPPAARDLPWSLLRARALTAAQRGKEALTELAMARPAVEAPGDSLARLELERAHAVAEAAAVRRGRPALPAAERARLHSDGLEALRRAAATAESPELKTVVLRELFAELQETGDLTAAIPLLEELRKVAPADVAGARPLWERGWRDYLAGNFRGAISSWESLRALYPRVSYARSADYWSARAFERLGDLERSRAGFVELTLADTTDFYARQASLRLAGTPRTVTPERDAAREDWPEDRRLARARWLSDLGLDRQALAEIDRLVPPPDRRATTALRGLVLSRLGRHRESLRELRTAFPQLATAHQETVPRQALELFYPRPYAAELSRVAAERSLPASLVYGIVHQESGFDATAKSRSGARGLMQLMPATGKELARRLGMTYSNQRLFEPEYSLRLGTTYFRQMLQMFDDRIELALAGYNGGPGRIQRLWRAEQPKGEVDRFLEGLSLSESRNYVKRILVLSESYRSLYSDLS